MLVVDRLLVDIQILTFLFFLVEELAERIPGRNYKLHAGFNGDADAGIGAEWRTTLETNTFPLRGVTSRKHHKLHTHNRHMARV